MEVYINPNIPEEIIDIVGAFRDCRERLLYETERLKSIVAENCLEPHTMEFNEIIQKLQQEMNELSKTVAALETTALVYDEEIRAIMELTVSLDK